MVHAENQNRTLVAVNDEQQGAVKSKPQRDDGTTLELI